jgi:hypothetical protein
MAISSVLRSIGLTRLLRQRPKTQKPTFLDRLTFAGTDDPAWIGRRNPIDIALAGHRAPMIGYTRWIAEHSDALIAKLIVNCPQLAFVDVGLFNGQNEPAVRHAIGRMAEREPVRFRRLVLSALLALKREGMQAMVLTLDWPPALREIAFACRTVGITTILVPHESVFSSEAAYYRHKIRGNNAPISDHVLCWGELQRRIFIERGYPAGRIRKVGSPKLDTDVNYRPTLPPAVFRSLFGFPDHCRVVLFTMQPMDNFGGNAFARERQASAISDVLDYCEARDYALVLRTPPSRDAIIPADLHARIHRSRRAALDIAGEYLVAPEEALAQADLVVSVNSTMLFEARLMRTPSIAMRYLPFESFWDSAGIDAAHDGVEFAATADRLLAAGDAGLAGAGLAWANDQFADGENGIDGRSFERIEAAILEILGEPPEPPGFALPIAEREDVIRPRVICGSAGVMNLGRPEDLAKALGADRVVAATDEESAAAGDLYLAFEGEVDPTIAHWQAALGRPLVTMRAAEVHRLHAAVTG